jgi:hypothetical protein
VAAPDDEGNVSDYWIIRFSRMMIAERVEVRWDHD